MPILRILNKVKNKNKKLIYILNKILGIGLNNSKLICTTLGYDYNIKFSQLTVKDLNKLNNIITIKYKFKILMDLENFNKKNIMNLKIINSYKGIRHSSQLPVNGQNTHNNAKTARLVWKNR